MDTLNTITLLAFLAALMRLDNSLPADLQNQLNEIGKTFPSDISVLHALAKDYSPLEQEYMGARLALQQNGDRFRSSELKTDYSAEVSEEKLINFAFEVLNADDSVNLVKNAYKESSLLGQFLFQLRRPTIRQLSELGGALPATRPYPGRDAIRQEVGKHLAKQILEEEA